MTNSAPDHQPPNPFDALKLANKLHGAIYTQLISVAAELQIADLLASGKKSVDELAEATGTISERLYRILRVLTSIGIFDEPAPRYFQQTNLSDPLRKDSPFSIRSLALMLGSEWHTRAWANIHHCLKNNTSAFDGIYHQNFFDYLKEHPEEEAVFNDTMTAQSQKQAAAICQVYDFSNATTIIDVGGGHGLLLSQILFETPGIKGVLFDQHSTVQAVSILPELKDRLRTEAGSFFESVPKGGDIYILKHILHDYDDDQAVRILQNCSAAMHSQSRILIVDLVLNPSTATFLRTWTDLEMMVLLNGKERTEEEFCDLFSFAGLKLQKIIPTKTDVSVLECTLKNPV